MIANNAFSLSVGLIPLVGDICVATFKTNSRNANLVENCTSMILLIHKSVLRERGQQNLQTTVVCRPKSTNPRAHGNHFLVPFLPAIPTPALKRPMLVGRVTLLALQPLPLTHNRHHPRPLAEYASHVQRIGFTVIRLTSGHIVSESFSRN